MKHKLFHYVLPCMFAALSGPALADEAGKAAFQENCAVCHGEAGKGDGYLAQYLNVPLPDLTTIKSRNNDEFPMLDVIHIVDGRTGVRGHGDGPPLAGGEMPIWGEVFKNELAGMAGPYGAETIIRGRVLSIAYYLESIQE